MAKEMRQIPITITAGSEYGWLGGLSLNEYVGRKGSYTRVSVSDGGVDPFRKPGVLQSGFFASNVNSFITTQINAMEVYLASGASRLYGKDIIGKIYQVETTNHANVSVIASLQTTNADTGLAVTRDYLFSIDNTNASVTQLNRFGPLSQGVAATTINVSMISQIQGVQIKHVLMPWKSNLYCLHAGNLDYLDGNGVLTGILTPGADLPAGMVVKCATPYGDKLAVGASDNLITFTTRGTRCNVYLYDGISNDWQKEIPFPENDIFNLSFETGELLAWGLKWLYRYNPSAGGFEAIEPLDSSVPSFSKAHGVNDGQVWFTGSNCVMSYGSPIRYLERVLNAPYGAVGSSGACKWINSNRLYVSNTLGNLLYLSAATDRSNWRSRFIDLQGVKARVAWVRVVTETLATNDNLNVGLRMADGNTYAIGSMGFSADGAILSKEFFAKDFTAEMPYATEFQFTLQFDTGNVKVRRIDMILETAPEY